MRRNKILEIVPSSSKSPDEPSGTTSNETSPDQTPNRRKRKLYTMTPKPDVSFQGRRKV